MRPPFVSIPWLPFFAFSLIVMHGPAPNWNIAAHLNLYHCWAARFYHDIQLVVLIPPLARLRRTWRAPLRRCFLAAFAPRLFARRPLGSWALFVKGDRTPI